MIHRGVMISILPIVRMFRSSLALKMNLIGSDGHRQSVLDLDLPSHLIVSNRVAVVDYAKHHSGVLVYCRGFLLNLIHGQINLSIKIKPEFFGRPKRSRLRDRPTLRIIRFIFYFSLVFLPYFPYSVNHCIV